MVSVQKFDCRSPEVSLGPSSEQSLHLNFPRPLAPPSLSPFSGSRLRWDSAFLPSSLHSSVSLVSEALEAVGALFEIFVSCPSQSSFPFSA